MWAIETMQVTPGVADTHNNPQQKGALRVPNLYQHVTQKQHKQDKGKFRYNPIVEKQCSFCGIFY